MRGIRFQPSEGKPTSVAFLGPDDMFVLEKATGKVQHIVNGVVQSTALDLAVSCLRNLQAISLAAEARPYPGCEAVDIFRDGNIILLVPRAAVATDVFNAIAERRRREILLYLAVREHAVGEIVAALRLRQSSVSKHLKVLRDVGLVEARRDGRQMLYRTNLEGIRPLFEWTRTFERFWGHQLTRVKERAEHAPDRKPDP